MVEELESRPFFPLVGAVLSGIRLIGYLCGSVADYQILAQATFAPQLAALPFLYIRSTLLKTNLEVRRIEDARDLCNVVRSPHRNCALVYLVNRGSCRQANYWLNVAVLATGTSLVMLPNILYARGS